MDMMRWCSAIAAKDNPLYPYWYAPEGLNELVKPVPKYLVFSDAINDFMGSTNYEVNKQILRHEMPWKDKNDKKIMI